jgi:hypothetical protein
VALIEPLGGVTTLIDVQEGLPQVPVSGPLDDRDN